MCKRQLLNKQVESVFFNNDFADYAFIVNLASIRSFEGYNVAWFMISKKGLLGSKFCLPTHSSLMSFVPKLN